MKYHPSAKFLKLYESSGTDLWEFFNYPVNLYLLVAASFMGRPAAEPMSARLVKKFGKSRFAKAQIRQMCGEMIYQVLSNFGFEKDTRMGVTRGSIFRTAMRYKYLEGEEIDAITRISRLIIDYNLNERNHQ